MDAETIEAYRVGAHKLAAAYESADMADLHQLLLRYLTKGGEILEIGCGSGRDSAFLAGQGYSVTATDASESMLKSAVARHPALAASLYQKSFPLSQDDLFLKREFDGLLCLAVLMHIPDHDLFETARQIGELIAPGGTLVLSSSKGRKDLTVDRDATGRLYLERPADQIQLLFERLGFRLLTTLERPDRMGRNIVWQYLVMEKRRDKPGNRSVDQIESVISRDKKDATYKLALLRALCSIAQTESHAVRWGVDGFVRVPLGLVAEKWLFYYWPIVALDGAGSVAVIPQKRGMEAKKPIAFRASLRNLIQAYGAAGLDSLYVDYKSVRLPAHVSGLLDRTMNSLANTIVRGPVTFTGGANVVFKFEGKAQASGRCGDPVSACASLGQILVPVPVWREMCLIGHWIEESLIIRWAELTHEITDKQVSVQKVIEQLLIVPSPERDVGFARKIFNETPDLTCVWTGDSLRMDWVIDHAVPYSLWHNNELWNLFPCAKKVNCEKSDKMVQFDQLHESRDRIIQTWEIFHAHAEERFAVEIGRSLLHGTGLHNWKARAFSGLVENIETVAAQRGCERWRVLRSKVAQGRSVNRKTPDQFLAYDEVGAFAFNTALPFVGDLAAGPWSNGFCFTSLDECRNAQWLKVSATLGGKNRFVVRVAGDSMTPTFRRGELLVFEYHRSPRQDSQVVIALLADTADGSEPQVAVKRLSQDRNNWRIISDNSAFPELTISKEVCSYPILGTYVGKVG